MVRFLFLLFWQFSQGKKKRFNFFCRTKSLGKKNHSILTNSKLIVFDEKSTILQVSSQCDFHSKKNNFISFFDLNILGKVLVFWKLNSKCPREIFFRKNNLFWFSKKIGLIGIFEWFKCRENQFIRKQKIMSFSLHSSIRIFSKLLEILFFWFLEFLEAKLANLKKQDFLISSNLWRLSQLHPFQSRF